MEAFCELFRFGVDCDLCLTFVCTHVWSFLWYRNSLPSSLTGGEEMPIPPLCGFSSFFLPMILCVFYILLSSFVLLLISVFNVWRMKKTSILKGGCCGIYSTQHIQAHTHMRMHRHLFTDVYNHPVTLPSQVWRKISVYLCLILFSSLLWLSISSPLREEAIEHFYMATPSCWDTVTLAWWATNQSVILHFQCTAEPEIDW